MKLDEARQALALSRADRMRESAADLRRKADALIASAVTLERTWMIPPPCHLCGRRDCGH